MIRALFNVIVTVGQATVFSSRSRRQKDIERILCFAANKMSPGLVHYLLIAIVVHGNLELAWKIFDSLDDYLLSQWEVLLWSQPDTTPKTPRNFLIQNNIKSLSREHRFRYAMEVSIHTYQYPP